jgi:hypothetical protein
MSRPTWLARGLPDTTIVRGALTTRAFPLYGQLEATPAAGALEATGDRDAQAARREAVIRPAAWQARRTTPFRSLVELLRTLQYL